MAFERLFEDTIPIRQEKRKYACFHVKDIGGPAEIAKWREIQAAKEHAYRIRLAGRDKRIAAFEAETKQRLDSPKLGRSSWSDRLSFAKSEQERLNKPAVLTHDPYQLPPEPGFWQRVVKFIWDFWASCEF